MELWVSKALAALVLPPGANLAAGGLGLLLLLGRRRRLAVALLVLALGSLLGLSLPGVANPFLRSLEIYPPLDPSRLDGAGAIVVLSAGQYAPAPEYGRDTVGPMTLVRMRYGARLHRQTGLPLLLSGGRVFTEAYPIASLMREAMTEELGVPVRWVEGESRNTWENAVDSSAILAAAGIEHVVLVTHAWHMPRAVEAFERAGLRITPAPTAFTRPGRGTLDWLPSAKALAASAFAAHEYVGRLWYRLRY